MSKKLSKPERIFVVDTNVLFDWFSSYLKNGDSKYVSRSQLIRIREFITTTDDPIFIPELVWAEFLGVAVQKGIEASSLDNAKKWMRDRLAIVNQMENIIFDSDNNIDIVSWDDLEFESDMIDDLYGDAESMTTDVEFINHHIFKNLESQVSASRRYNFPANPKIFDGIDALIMSFVNGVAKSHPKNDVVLVTADTPLRNSLQRLKEYFEWFAKNIKAMSSRGRR